MKKLMIIALSGGALLLLAHCGGEKPGGGDEFTSTPAVCVLQNANIQGDVAAPTCSKPDFSVKCVKKGESVTPQCAGPDDKVATDVIVLCSQGAPSCNTSAKSRVSCPNNNAPTGCPDGYSPGCVTNEAGQKEYVCTNDDIMNPLHHETEKPKCPGGETPQCL